VIDLGDQQVEALGRELCLDGVQSLAGSDGPADHHTDVPLRGAEVL